MSFVLNSIITIGAYKFKGVHEVKIVKSIHNGNDYCSITIPATCRLKPSGPNATVSTEQYKTENQFNRGDKVIVQLGYNGSYNTEFEGFVMRFNQSTPCIVECEGYIFQLNKQLQPKVFTNADFKDVLNYIISGTDITLAPEMANETFKIDRLIIANDQARQIIELLRNKYALTIFFHGNQLFAGLEFTQLRNTVKYQIGWNTIKDDELKLHNAGDYEVQVVIVGGGRKTNNIQTATAGDNTSNIVKKRLPNVTDASTLQKIANAEYTKQSFTGYEGKVTTFGLPVIEHGDKAVLDDPRYPERSGSYVVDAVETFYNRSGFRRKVNIAIKVG
jgi:hypothetical protein